MSRTYIPQTPNNDFVYPNNDRVEYDLVISHPINDNCPTGSISGLTLSQTTSSGITLNYDFTFNQNGSIPFFRTGTDNHGYLSVHMLTPVQTYMKPWRIVDSLSDPTYSSTHSGSQSVYISASDFGVDGFYSGTYTFEFRLISENCVTVICNSAVLVGITPTPTPSATEGGPTPTATPTPTPTPTATLQPGICVTNYAAAMAPCIGGTLDEYMEGSIELSAVTPVEATFELLVGYIDGTPSGNCGNPLVYETLTVTVEAGQSSGLLTCPYAPFINSNGATICTVDFVTGDYPICCTIWGLTGSTLSGELLIVQYNDCDGDPQEEVIGWNSQNPITRTICAESGSVVIVDQGLGTDAQDTLTSCT
jgi:hypothetical protein